MSLTFDEKREVLDHVSAIQAAVTECITQLVTGDPSAREVKNILLTISSEASTTHKFVGEIVYWQDRRERDQKQANRAARGQALTPEQKQAEIVKAQQALDELSKLSSDS